MNPLTIAVREQGIVAIVRTATADTATRNVATLIASGLRVVEVSLVTPGALEVIRGAEVPDDVLVGVGTALTADDVARAASAGARFVVSPVLREGVVKAALDAGLEPLPGVATPSEAIQAVEWGASLVKVFPASMWSPAALRDVLAAMPWLETVPTGGVTLDSGPDWIRAGAVGLGIGGSLTRADDPARTARDLISAIAAARSASAGPSHA